LFVFAGTVGSTDQIPPSHLKDKINEARERRKEKLKEVFNSEKIKVQKKQSQQKHFQEARYREIKLHRQGNKSRPNEEEEIEDFFHLVDLVKSDESSHSSKQKKEGETSELMCNFMPLVREYLDTHKIKSPQEEEGEFVWDVYYEEDEGILVNEKDQPIVARIETFDEGINDENEYDSDADTDSEDEENRVTDIYPSDEDTTPDDSEESDDGYHEDSESDDYDYEVQEE